MSLEDGMAALRLQMPRRVPRTDYSLTLHYDLIESVTGVRLTAQSPWPLLCQTMKTFYKSWPMDLEWSVLIYGDQFGKFRTNMGHASYADKGTDFVAVGPQSFDDPDKVLAFDPTEAFGKVDHNKWKAKFEQHYKAAREDWPDEVTMTGTYITLMSGLIDLLGWDMLLLTAGVDAVGFGDLANRYAKWMQGFFDALADSNVPVIMVHDDIVWTAGAFMKPDWYRQYIFPNYKRFFKPLKDSGKIIIYTSDGNYTEFFDDVVQAGANCLVMEPCSDMRCFAQKYGKTHGFIGNADTRILLSGSKADIRAEVERCMDIGKKCPGFFMAVGNHIPPNTPVESASYYNQVYLELSRR